MQSLQGLQNIANLATKPSSFYWDVRYEANELPQDATPAWDWHGGDFTEEISPAGILHLINTGEPSFYDIENDFDLEVGLTVEAKLKVVSSAEENLSLAIDDDEHIYKLEFVDDVIILTGVSEGDQEYEMDTTDDYHIYRITDIEGIIKVYVDGVLRLSGTAEGDEGGTPGITFGSQPEIEGNWESNWDYLYYRTDGVFAP